MVSAGRQGRRHGRELARARLHGDQAVGLRASGKTCSASSTGCSKTPATKNAYFPLFIPLSFLEKEAEHVEGFAKECAVVTHHRLEAGPGRQAGPPGKLEEPFIVRPTSETIIGAMYAKWVQSTATCPFSSTSGPTSSAGKCARGCSCAPPNFSGRKATPPTPREAEAMEETRKMLDVYADFAEDHMAMPVIRGEKTAGERFPGAVNTYCIEAMMQDRKALQAGTSHFLGQNFSKAQEIKFLEPSGQEEFAWTTSWGVSTRLIGGVIMTHGDDDGLSSRRGWPRRMS